MGPVSPICNGPAASGPSPFSDSASRHHVPRPPSPIERRPAGRLVVSGGARAGAAAARRPGLAGGRRAGRSGSADPQGAEGAAPPPMWWCTTGWSPSAILDLAPPPAPADRAWPSASSRHSYAQDEINRMLVAFARAGPDGGAAEGRRSLRLRPRRRGAGGLPRGRRGLRRGAGHHRGPGRLRRRRRAAHPSRRGPGVTFVTGHARAGEAAGSRLAGPGPGQPDGRRLHGPRQGRPPSPIASWPPAGAASTPALIVENASLPHRTPHPRHPRHPRPSRPRHHRPRPPDRRRGDGAGARFHLPRPLNGEGGREAGTEGAQSSALNPSTLSPPPRATPPSRPLRRSTSPRFAEGGEKP